MPNQASEFFGEDFGVVHEEVAAATPPLPKFDPPKSVAQNAASFFGMDFSAPPIPRRKDAPNKFEEVFSRLITQESGGKHTDGSGKLTTSNKGAKGLTQVMPGTGVDPGYGVAPLKDQSSAEYKRFGKDYLKAMLSEFNGDYEKALAAYNAGVGNVKEAIEKGGKKWKDHLPKPSETLPYIERILGKSGVMREGSDYSGNVLEDRRGEFEALPKVSAKEVLATGFNKIDARNQWVDKMEMEFEKALKGKTRAQKDKMWSNSWYFAKEKYPKEAAAYMHFHNQSADADIPVHAKSFLETYNPNMSFTSMGLSAKGWVYTGNGDRVFLTPDGDAATMVHETEHLRQQKDWREMGDKAPHTRFGAIGKMGEPVAKLRRLSLEMRDDPDFKKVWRADNAFESSNEWLANLQAFAKTGIPEGESWSDTGMYKKLVAKVGKEDAHVMLLDALMTLQRAPYTKER